MTSPINLASEATKQNWASQSEFEKVIRQAQVKAELKQLQASTADAEWSDAGRDLARFPRGWWVAWAVVITLACGLAAAGAYGLYRWLYPWG